MGGVRSNRGSHGARTFVQRAFIPLSETTRLPHPATGSLCQRPLTSLVGGSQPFLSSGGVGTLSAMLTCRSRSSLHRYTPCCHNTVRSALPDDMELVAVSLPASFSRCAGAPNSTEMPPWSTLRPICRGDARHTADAAPPDIRSPATVRRGPGPAALAPALLDVFRPTPPSGRCGCPTCTRTPPRTAPRRRVLLPMATRPARRTVAQSWRRSSGLQPWHLAMTAPGLPYIRHPPRPGLRVWLVEPHPRHALESPRAAVIPTGAPVGVRDPSTFVTPACRAPGRGPRLRRDRRHWLAGGLSRRPPRLSVDPLAAPVGTPSPLSSLRDSSLRAEPGSSATACVRGSCPGGSVYRLESPTHGLRASPAPPLDRHRGSGF